ncbi:hypothetical protein Tco_1198951, partial [Tanacetum coccineum]
SNICTTVPSNFVLPFTDDETDMEALVVGPGLAMSAETYGIGTLQTLGTALLHDHALDLLPLQKVLECCQEQTKPLLC